jgi:hypothetical protein
VFFLEKVKVKKRRRKIRKVKKSGDEATVRSRN